MAFAATVLCVTVLTSVRGASVTFSVNAYSGVNGTTCDSYHRCEVTVTDVTGGNIGITGTLTGLMANMASPVSSVPNSDGYHIHTDSSCENGAAAGTHYYPGRTIDPWASVTWASGDSGVATFSVTMSDFSLRGVNPVAGRAFVIHDMTGARVACGLIGTADSAEGSSAEVSGWGMGVIPAAWAAVAALVLIMKSFCCESHHECEKEGVLVQTNEKVSAVVSTVNEDSVLAASAVMSTVNEDSVSAASV